MTVLPALLLVRSAMQVTVSGNLLIFKLTLSMHHLAFVHYSFAVRRPSNGGIHAVLPVPCCLTAATF